MRLEGEVNFLFATKLADWTLEDSVMSDSPLWRDSDMRHCEEGPPIYTRSMDALSPWIESSKEMTARKEDGHYIVQMVTEDGEQCGGHAPSLPMAIVAALLASKGVRL